MVAALVATLSVALALSAAAAAAAPCSMAQNTAVDNEIKETPECRALWASARAPTQQAQCYCYTTIASAGFAFPVCDPGTHQTWDQTVALCKARAGSLAGGGGGSGSGSSSGSGSGAAGGIATWVLATAGLSCDAFCATTTFRAAGGSIVKGACTEAEWPQGVDELKGVTAGMTPNGLGCQHYTGGRWRGSPDRHIQMMNGYMLCFFYDHTKDYHTKTVKFSVDVAFNTRSTTVGGVAYKRGGYCAQHAKKGPMSPQACATEALKAGATHFYQTFTASAAKPKNCYVCDPVSTLKTGNTPYALYSIPGRCPIKGGRTDTRICPCVASTSLLADGTSGSNFHSR